MTNILTDLYHLLAPQTQTEDKKLILERNSDKIEQIERQVSEQDISSFMDVQTELSTYREETAFVRGFQLAVQILFAARD
ncbi:MAG: hypothetical protein K2O45_06100 [Oscillospiraceae bacterium]|nr:hypothetical protein [Oscillospiraceae bacterium]